MSGTEDRRQKGKVYRMGSLRGIHLAFILIVFVASDMFGAWAFWSHSQTPEVLLLVAGVLSFAFGFAVIAYAFWFVRKLDQAQIK